LESNDFEKALILWLSPFSEEKSTFTIKLLERQNDKGLLTTLTS